MGTCCSVPSVEEAESAQQFRQVDANKNNLMDHKEMEAYVKSHAEMWAMLSVNLGLSEDICQKTATRVAMELASGQQGKAALDAQLTETQFHNFRSKYMVDGKGAQEFFHRCVFASFAKNGKQHLDANMELDAFLDIFYKNGSIFEGDTRLPPKGDLKARILSGNRSGRVTFDQIRDIIRGTTGNITSSAPSPLPSTVSTTNQSSGSLHEAAPEQTPEPTKDLAPPSIELSARHNPEQTPEVRPLPPPSPPKQQRPRQRKPKTDRAASRSRSPSQRKNRAASRSRSPSQRKARTTSRSASRSPSQRKIRTKTPEGSSTEGARRKPRQSIKGQQQSSPSKPRTNKRPSGSAPPQKRRPAAANQPSAKSKRQ